MQYNEGSLRRRRVPTAEPNQSYHFMYEFLFQCKETKKLVGNIKLTFLTANSVANSLKKKVLYANLNNN